MINKASEIGTVQSTTSNPYTYTYLYTSFDPWARHDVACGGWCCYCGTICSFCYILRYIDCTAMSSYNNNRPVAIRTDTSLHKHEKILEDSRRPQKRFYKFNFIRGSYNTRHIFTLYTIHVTSLHYIVSRDGVSIELIQLFSTCI